jgi:AraC family ethanolamine operon transcriptional activator
MALPQPAVWTAAFTHPEQMSAAQRDANLESIALPHGGNYQSRLTLVDFGVARVHDALDDAHIARGVFAAKTFGVLFPRGPIHDGLRFNGCSFDPAQAIFLKPGSEIHVVMTGRQQWSGLILDEKRFEAVVDERWLRTTARFFMVDGLLAREPGLRSFATEVSHLAQSDASRLGDGSVPSAMMDCLSELLERAAAPSGNEWHRYLHLHRRVRLVARAEEFLRSAINRAIYTQDVASALGVPNRTLSEAFVAVYGMSIHRFLRVWRLNLAHRALTAGGASPSLVKSVALDFGYWHLGRFAKEYRTIFGVSPSESALVSRNAAAA